MKSIDSLETIKEIELEIMQSVHAFCVRNDIKYSLAYGTLLGAIRHNGFIPWDDDIDIVMNREDYLRFKKIFQETDDMQGLYLATYDTNPHYPRDMIKVCDKRTQLIEKDFQEQDPIGVFVDIWPIDGTPNNGFLRWIHGKRMGFRRVAFEKGVLTKTAISERSAGLKRFASLLLHNVVNSIGIDRYLHKNIKLCMKYRPDESEIVECFSAPAKLVHFKQATLEKVELHQFETNQFFIPREWDDILRRRYGNYLELPPESERIPRHISDVYWLEES